MALNTIKKIYFFTIQQDHHPLLGMLQKSGLVQLVSSETVLSPKDLSDMLPKVDPQHDQKLQQIEKKLSNLTDLITLLEKKEKPSSLLTHFLHPREISTLNEFEKLSEFDESEITDQVKQLQKAEERWHISQRKNQFHIRQLKLIENWPIKLQALQDTQQTFIQLLIAPESETRQICLQLEEMLGEASLIEVVSRTSRQQVMMIIGRKNKKENFLKWVEERTLELLQIDEFSGSAAENIFHLASWVDESADKLETLDQQYRQLVPHLPILRKVYDYWISELERLKKISLMRQSRYTSMICGWIPDRNIAELNRLLNDVSTDVAVAIKEANPEDSPPVSYQNPPLVKPFEFVTDLYSRPRYWEIDPSPFVGVFFALFFGICLTDAGYGILITLAALGALKKLELAAGSQKLVRILLYGGIATTIIGLLTGGIFGMGFGELPAPLHYLQYLTLLNPMQEQMNFLIFTMILGILHVTLGIIIKFNWQLHHNLAKDAWLDQAPWLAIILGVVILIAANLTERHWMNLPGYVFLIGAALVILFFGGRSIKNPFARLAMGAFSLYQVTGLFGDVLSYARLFALGIATGVIAGVVNFLADMAFEVPYAGYVLMPVILISGHTLNLAINALGGFIHTTRLQFVEFFGKFYEGGGEAFEPFQLTLKYTQIREQD